MDTYLGIVQGWIGSNDALLFIVVVGLTVATAAWGTFQVVALFSNPLRRRLNALQDAESPEGVPGGRWKAWLDRLRPYLGPKQASTREGMGELLRQAGFHSEYAVTVMYAAKILSGAVAVFALSWAAGSFDYPKAMAVSVALFAAFTLYMAWKVPNIFIEHRIDARKRRLLDGLPDVLDLLVVCTEAGLGFNAAIGRVAEQLPVSNAELAWELQQVNAEIRAGVDRDVALRNLADRTGLEDIRGLVALMMQSMRFGTGITETLRIYSEEFRDRRMQAAEEMAAKVGTKLIFPLVLCIFPAFFLVATGPAIIGVMRALAGTPLN